MALVIRLPKLELNLNFFSSLTGILALLIFGASFGFEFLRVGNDTEGYQIKWQSFSTYHESTHRQLSPLLSIFIVSCSTMGLLVLSIIGVISRKRVFRDSLWRHQIVVLIFLLAIFCQVFLLLLGWQNCELSVQEHNDENFSCTYKASFWLCASSATLTVISSILYIISYVRDDGEKAISFDKILKRYSCKPEAVVVEKSSVDASDDSDSDSTKN